MSHSPKHDETDKRRQYIRVFNHFDRNRDGKISPLELLQCVESVKGVEITMEEVEILVETASKDKKGTIGLEEFISLAEDEEEEERIYSLREAFKMYEMDDGSGRITDKSLKRMLSSLGDKRSVGECRAMISAFDLDGDGTLDFEEFKVMMA